MNVKPKVFSHLNGLVPFNQSLEGFPQILQYIWVGTNQLETWVSVSGSLFGVNVIRTNIESG